MYVEMQQKHEGCKLNWISMKPRRMDNSKLAEGLESAIHYQIGYAAFHISSSTILMVLLWFNFMYWREDDQYRLIEGMEGAPRSIQLCWKF